MEKVDFTFQHNEFSLVNGSASLDKNIIDDNFIDLVGEADCLQFINRPYFTGYFEGNNDTNLNSISDGIFGELAGLINNLWFCKDCCVSVNTLYLYIPKQKRLIKRRSTGLASNCNATFSNCKIDEEEIKKAQKIFYIFRKEIIHKSIKREKDYPAKGTSKMIIPSIYYLDYNLHRRLDKCLMFLTMARGQHFLPMKISLYISILECLFSTDSSELSHKIAERAALYQGSDKEEMYLFFKSVKYAYDYRSKFLHGQKLKEKKDSYEHLIEVSTLLDDLLRKVLNKAVLKDFDLINSIENNELNEYFNKKLFE